MNGLLIGGAFLVGSVLGAAAMYLQMKEIFETRQEIKDAEIARLKIEARARKQKEPAEEYIPTLEEFLKAREQEAIREQIKKMTENQEVDYNGNF